MGTGIRFYPRARVWVGNSLPVAFKLLAAGNFSTRTKPDPLPSLNTSRHSLAECRSVKNLAKHAQEYEREKKEDRKDKAHASCRSFKAMKRELLAIVSSHEAARRSRWLALVKFMLATHDAYRQLKMPGLSGPITVHVDVKTALA
uniref:Uncharacterized protein n=1 Tax=Oryza brachyantha TaxID=4533 RepID=J3LCU5_ORYBR